MAYNSYNNNNPYGYRNYDRRPYSAYDEPHSRPPDRQPYMGPPYRVNNNFRNYNDQQHMINGDVSWYKNYNKRPPPHGSYPWRGSLKSRGTEKRAPSTVTFQPNTSTNDQSSSSSIANEETNSSELVGSSKLVGPANIKVEDEDSDDDIVFVGKFKDESKDAFTRFHDEIKPKLLPLVGMDTGDEIKFIEGLTAYKDALEAKVELFTDRKRLMDTLLKQLLFISKNYQGIGVIYQEKYLDLMEELLGFYCEVAKKYFGDAVKTKKDVCAKQEARRIKTLLQKCLLKRIDRAYHILMKASMDADSKDFRTTWTDVFTFFLNKAIKRYENDDILRGFIVCQRYKLIRAKEDADKLDQWFQRKTKKSAEDMRKIPLLGEIIEKITNSRITLRNAIQQYLRYYRERQRKEEIIVDESTTHTKHSITWVPNSFELLDSPYTPSPHSNFYKVINERKEGKRKSVLDMAGVVDDEIDDSVVVLDDDSDDDNVVIVSENNQHEVITIDDEEEPVSSAISFSSEPNSVVIIEETIHSTPTCRSSEPVLQKSTQISKISSDNSIESISRISKRQNALLAENGFLQILPEDEEDAEGVEDSNYMNLFSIDDSETTALNESETTEKNSTAPVVSDLSSTTIDKTISSKEKPSNADNLITSDSISSKVVEGPNSTPQSPLAVGTLSNKEVLLPPYRLNKAMEVEPLASKLSYKEKLDFFLQSLPCEDPKMNKKDETKDLTIETASLSSEVMETASCVDSLASEESSHNMSYNKIVKEAENLLLNNKLPPSLLDKLLNGGPDLVRKIEEFISKQDSSTDKKSKVTTKELPLDNKTDSVPREISVNNLCSTTNDTKPIIVSQCSSELSSNIDAKSLANKIKGMSISNMSNNIIKNMSENKDIDSLEKPLSSSGNVPTAPKENMNLEVVPPKESIADSVSKLSLNSSVNENGKLMVEAGLPASKGLIQSSDDAVLQNLPSKESSNSSVLLPSKNPSDYDQFSTENLLDNLNSRDVQPISPSTSSPHTALTAYNSLEDRVLSNINNFQKNLPANDRKDQNINQAPQNKELVSGDLPQEGYTDVSSCSDRSSSSQNALPSVNKGLLTSKYLLLPHESTISDKLPSKENTLEELTSAKTEDIVKTQGIANSTMKEEIVTLDNESLSISPIVKHSILQFKDNKKLSTTASGKRQTDISTTEDEKSEESVPPPPYEDIDVAEALLHFTRKESNLEYTDDKTVSEDTSISDTSCSTSYNSTCYTSTDTQQTINSSDPLLMDVPSEDSSGNISSLEEDTVIEAKTKISFEKEVEYTQEISQEILVPACAESTSLQAFETQEDMESNKSESFSPDSQRRSHLSDGIPKFLAEFAGEISVDSTPPCSVPVESTEAVMVTIETEEEKERELIVSSVEILESSADNALISTVYVTPLSDSGEEAVVATKYLQKEIVPYLGDIQSETATLPLSEGLSTEDTCLKENLETASTKIQLPSELQMYTPETSPIYHEGNEELDEAKHSNTLTLSNVLSDEPSSSISEDENVDSMSSGDDNFAVCERSGNNKLTIRRLKKKQQTLERSKCLSRKRKKSISKTATEKEIKKKSKMGDKSEETSPVSSFLHSSESDNELKLSNIAYVSNNVWPSDFRNDLTRYKTTAKAVTPDVVDQFSQLPFHNNLPPTCESETGEISSVDSNKIVPASDFIIDNQTSKPAKLAVNNAVSLNQTSRAKLQKNVDQFHYPNSSEYNPAMSELHVKSSQEKVPVTQELHVLEQDSLKLSKDNQNKDVQINNCELGEEPEQEFNKVTIRRTYARSSKLICKDLNVQSAKSVTEASNLPLVDPSFTQSDTTILLQDKSDELTRLQDLPNKFNTVNLASKSSTYNYEVQPNSVKPICAFGIELPTKKTHEETCKSNFVTENQQRLSFPASYVEESMQVISSQLNDSSVQTKKSRRITRTKRRSSLEQFPQKDTENVFEASRSSSNLLQATSEPIHSSHNTSRSKSILSPKEEKLLQQNKPKLTSTLSNNAIKHVTADSLIQLTDPLTKQRSNKKLLISEHVQEEDYIHSNNELFNNGIEGPLTKAVANIQNPEDNWNLWNEDSNEAITKKTDSVQSDIVSNRGTISVVPDTQLYAVSMKPAKGLTSSLKKTKSDVDSPKKRVNFSDTPDIKEISDKTKTHPQQEKQPNILNYNITNNYSPQNKYNLLPSPEHSTNFTSNLPYSNDYYYKNKNFESLPKQLSKNLQDEPNIEKIRSPSVENMKTEDFSTILKNIETSGSISSQDSPYSPLINEETLNLNNPLLGEHLTFANHSNDRWSNPLLLRGDPFFGQNFDESRLTSPSLSLLTINDNALSAYNSLGDRVLYDINTFQANRPKLKGKKKDQNINQTVQNQEFIGVTLSNLPYTSVNGDLQQSGFIKNSADPSVVHKNNHHLLPSNSFDNQNTLSSNAASIIPVLQSPAGYITTSPFQTNTSYSSYGPATPPVLSPSQNTSYVRMTPPTLSSPQNVPHYIHPIQHVDPPELSPPQYPNLSQSCQSHSQPGTKTVVKNLLKMQKQEEGYARMPLKKRKLTKEDEELARILAREKKKHKNENESTNTIMDKERRKHTDVDEEIAEFLAKLREQDSTLQPIKPENISYPAQRQISIADLPFLPIVDENQSFIHKVDPPRVKTLAARKSYPSTNTTPQDSSQSHTIKHSHRPPHSVCHEQSVNLDSQSHFSPHPISQDNRTQPPKQGDSRPSPYEVLNQQVQPSLQQNHHQIRYETHDQRTQPSNQQDHRPPPYEPPDPRPPPYEPTDPRSQSCITNDQCSSSSGYKQPQNQEPKPVTVEPHHSNVMNVYINGGGSHQLVVGPSGGGQTTMAFNIMPMPSNGGSTGSNHVTAVTNNEQITPVAPNSAIFSSPNTMPVVSTNVTVAGIPQNPTIVPASLTVSGMGQNSAIASTNVTMSGVPQNVVVAPNSVFLTPSSVPSNINISRDSAMVSTNVSIGKTSRHMGKNMITLRHQENDDDSLVTQDEEAISGRPRRTRRNINYADESAPIVAKRRRGRPRKNGPKSKGKNPGNVRNGHKSAEKRKIHFASEPEVIGEVPKKRIAVRTDSKRKAKNSVAKEKTDVKKNSAASKAEKSQKTSNASAKAVAERNDITTPPVVPVVKRTKSGRARKQTNKDYDDITQSQFSVDKKQLKNLVVQLQPLNINPNNSSNIV